MASSSLFILLVLSFLLTAAQSHPMHGSLADKGLPRGIIPDTFSSFSIRSDGLLTMKLKTDFCGINFLSTVSQLGFSDPITANLTYGQLEFFSVVVMRLGPSASDLRRLTNVVARPPGGLIIEFWSTVSNLEASVLASPFSKEKPCEITSVENPGAALADGAALAEV